MHPCYYAAVLHIWPNQLLLAKKNIWADIIFILKTQKLMPLVEIVPTDNLQISYFARFRTNAEMNGSACPYWEARRDTLIPSAIVRNWAQCENLQL